MMMIAMVAIACSGTGLDVPMHLYISAKGESWFRGGWVWVGCVWCTVLLYSMLAVRYINLQEGQRLEYSNLRCSLSPCTRDIKTPSTRRSLKTNKPQHPNQTTSSDKGNRDSAMRAPGSACHSPRQTDRQTDLNQSTEKTSRPRKSHRSNVYALRSSKHESQISSSRLRTSGG